jgi:hypothetical protein
VRSKAKRCASCVSTDAARGRAGRDLKRVVVDPKVLFSALVGNPEAAPAILLDAIHDHVVEMVACPMLIAEHAEAVRTEDQIAVGV